MKLEEMAMILGKAAVVFPSHKLTSEFVKAWHSFFENVETLEFEPALRAAIMEPGRTFFPTVGEVNRYLEVAKPQLPDAGEVWSKLIGMAGGRESPWLYLQNNPVGQLALRHVGWDALKYSDIEKELPFRKREFIQVYNQALQSTQAKERATSAIGAIEAKHVLNGISRKLLGAEQ